MGPRERISVCPICGGSRYDDRHECKGIGRRGAPLFSPEVQEALLTSMSPGARAYAEAALAGHPLPSDPQRQPPAVTLPDAWTLAQWFHEEYERLAPGFGYETRPESRTTFDDLPQANRLTMVATAQAVLDRITGS